MDLETYLPTCRFEMDPENCCEEKRQREKDPEISHEDTNLVTFQTEMNQLGTDRSEIFKGKTNSATFHLETDLIGMTPGILHKEMDLAGMVPETFHNEMGLLEMVSETFRNGMDLESCKDEMDPGASH